MFFFHLLTAKTTLACPDITQGFINEFPQQIVCISDDICITFDEQMLMDILGHEFFNTFPLTLLYLLTYYLVDLQFKFVSLVAPILGYGI